MVFTESFKKSIKKVIPDCIRNSMGWDKGTKRINNIEGIEDAVVFSFPLNKPGYYVLVQIYHDKLDDTVTTTYQIEGPDGVIENMMVGNLQDYIENDNPLSVYHNGKCAKLVKRGL